ncbi:MAG: glycosyltransferase family 4 protein [Bacteroidales bacterium]|nr:glycosyltransferase family 4 protein [Bacteroidales bacterium]MBD5348258.1 glycosyltransferase family 4 protein [Bacteroides sp.]MBD5348396.1 glycosyltransferase family 4 protein [Bacteroides sp.]
MTVLVCIPCLLTGGTEIQTLSLVNALVASGHEVSVACYFEFDESMVHRFKEAGARIFLMSPEGKRPIGLRKTASFLFRKFREIIKTVKPDAAHVQYMAPGALPVLILKLQGIKKIIATSHTNADIYSATGLRMIRLLTRTCLSAFQCITLNAEKSYFGKSGLFDNKLTRHFTIYNSLPSHIRIRPRPRPCLSAGQPCTIGVVSRLEKIKGMDLVIPAICRIAAAFPATRLLVVGDGSLRKEMEFQAQQSGLGDSINFAGRAPQSELSDWYDKIDILLMPSRSEGFGLTALEGMARGCVPVVADTGGLPEVVRDGIDGLVHKPESADDLAAKVIYLLENIGLLNTLGYAAQTRARSFSENEYRNKIATLYS